MDVLTVKLHEEEEGRDGGKYSMKCSGKCVCYDGWNEDVRRIGGSGLMFSHRLTSVVVVSVIGYAVSKFVNDRIHDCYEMTKDQLMMMGDDKSFISCSMEEVECEEDELEKEIRNREDKYKFRRYRCNGRCLTKKLRHPSAIDSANLMDCELQFYGEEIVEINDPSSSGGWHFGAEIEYRKRYLVPYCKTFETWYDRIDKGKKKTVRIYPCTGSRKSGGLHEYIDCIEITEKSQSV